MEPGTGEINYRGIARALKAMGYRGPVGMEAFASGDPEAALAGLPRRFHRLTEQTWSPRTPVPPSPTSAP